MAAATSSSSPACRSPSGCWPAAARPVAALLPVALLAALIATQTFAGGLDARAAGLLAAVVAVRLRAPFLVVVAAAAVTTAGLRLLA